MFQRYCGRCHGARDIRSGSIVFHSKNTIVSRYRDRPRQLLHKLRNIDKYSISNIMITAIHRISDKRILVPIVKYLAGPGSTEDSREAAP